MQIGAALRADRRERQRGRGVPPPCRRACRRPALLAIRSRHSCGRAAGGPSKSGAVAERPNLVEPRPARRPQPGIGRRRSRRAEACAQLDDAAAGRATEAEAPRRRGARPPVAAAPSTAAGAPSMRRRDHRGLERATRRREPTSRTGWRSRRIGRSLVRQHAGENIRRPPPPRRRRPRRRTAGATGRQAARRAEAIEGTSRSPARRTPAPTTLPTPISTSRRSRRVPARRAARRPCHIGMEAVQRRARPRERVGLALERLPPCPQRTASDEAAAPGPLRGAAMREFSGDGPTDPRCGRRRCAQISAQLRARRGAAPRRDSGGSDARQRVGVPCAHVDETTPDER